jgi:hypothetical protein
MLVTTNSKIAPSHSADQALILIAGLKVDIDPFAGKALDFVAETYRAKTFMFPGGLVALPPKDMIIRHSLTGRVTELSLRLESSRVLDDVGRLLLSHTDIYAALIGEVLSQERVNPDDMDGFYNGTLRLLQGEARRFFLARLLAEVVNARGLKLSADEKQWKGLSDLTMQRGLPIRTGQLEPAVIALFETIAKEGVIPFYLDKYIAKSEIPRTAFTPKIKQGMIDYLVKLGVQITSDERFNQGMYDEYFLLAYHEAKKVSGVSEDPIEQARTRNTEIFWNFTVDNFEATDEQGVIPHNILAAGALDYVYCIGDQMQVFNVANALVLRWASGMLDIPDGKTATDLYRFHKMRPDRSTPEERAMLYTRVLNKGNGKLLSNMVPNKDFPKLWHSLMAEVAEYIKKTEISRAGDVVSRGPIFQATKNLQYNLTEYMTGMAHRQVHEDYAFLRDALDLLKSSEIIGYFGGRRKSLWNVIEQVAKEDLGMPINTANIRSLAVEGNKVFHWLANFTEGAVREEEFKTFIAAAEAWILAEAGVESDREAPSKDPKPGRSRRKDDSDFDQRDDFDDWDF